MEEKKFPWLLRLLATNRYKVPMIDTIAANKERVIAYFTMDFNSNVSRISSKSLGFSTTQGCLRYVFDSKNLGKNDSFKYCSFLHNGKRRELTNRELSYYSAANTRIPVVSYIQFTREKVNTFVIFTVTHTRKGYNSTLFPTFTNPRITEQAKDISKLLISLIELHEGQKVLKLETEYMLDNSLKLWLSNLILCQMQKKETFTKFKNSLKNLEKIKINELADIINELDSPSKILQRKPSFIKKIDKQNSIAERIRIESPDFTDSESNGEDEKSENSENTSIVVLDGKKDQLNKNFLELLCRTRIVEHCPVKKILISDEDYKHEYEKVLAMIGHSHQVNPESKTWIRNSKIFRKVRKTGSIMFSEVKIHTGRSNSGFDSLLPVLASNRTKSEKKYKKF